jgi:2-(1,2-epoxy-1,2-dihydrophenyl)acetyl-CoA isomerase
MAAMALMTHYEHLLIDHPSPGVAVATLNRPDRRNALTFAMFDELSQLCREVAADDDTRVLILTGSGQAFCAGLDLADAATLSDMTATQFMQGQESWADSITSFRWLPKPVIAAVNGVAAGAGAGFAFACDFRIASQKASFLLAFVNVGLSLDSGASWTLPRLIGSARATALSLLGEPVDAEAALEMGLVNAVVEPDRVLPAAHELAARLAAGPTAAYAAIKESIAYAATSTLHEALAKEAQMQERTGATIDHHAAVAAFVAKQRPTFTGR